MDTIQIRKLVYLLALAIALLIIEFIYLKLARRINIFSPSNERSSHYGNAIIGGGIIFFFSIFIYSVYYNFPYPSVLLGATFLAVISFIDDVSYVKHSYRMLVHLLALTLFIPELSFQGYSYFFVFCIIILGISVLNGFNFIDGINGMLGIQSLVVLASLAYINREMKFIDESLIQSLIIAILVFLIFNFRKNALCFAGDIGSITLGYFIFFIIISLIMVTNNFFYLLLFSVTGADAGLTLLFRIMTRDNILLPHRTFLFHILVHTAGFSHLRVTIVYGLIQLLICGFTIIFVDYSALFKILSFIIIIVILIIVYLLLRNKYYTLKVKIWQT